MIDRRFGTYRGLIRLWLDNLRVDRSRFGVVDFSRVRRLVFVCQGNICRSPFAHHVATGMAGGVPVASMGLSTTTGIPANDMAQDVALDFGVDLSGHVATDVSDFDIRTGDLFLVMEQRHIDGLLPQVRGLDVQVGLLGLWCRPRMALLYDPHNLSRDYFVTCFVRIRQAVDALMADVNAFKSVSGVGSEPGSS